MSQSQNSHHTKKPLNPLVFRKIISQYIKDIAESVSKEDFLKIFSDLELERKKVNKIHDVVVKNLCDNTNDVLDQIITDEDVLENIKTLSKLSDNTTINGTAWRPPGNVKLHMRSLDVKKMKEEYQQLAAQVTELETEKDELMKQVQERRQKFEEIAKETSSYLIGSKDILSRLEKRSTTIQDSISDIYED